MAGEDDIRIVADLDVELDAATIGAALDILGSQVEATARTSGTKFSKILTAGVQTGLNDLKASLAKIERTVFESGGANNITAQRARQAEFRLILEQTRQFYSQLNAINEQNAVAQDNNERNRRNRIRAETQASNADQRAALQAQAAFNRSTEDAARSALETQRNTQRSNTTSQQEEARRLTIVLKQEQERQTEQARQELLARGREEIAATRQANAQVLIAERSENAIELADQRAHHTRLNEVIQAGLTGALATWRNFLARRREDQRSDNKLSIISEEEASKSRLAVLGSELESRRVLQAASLRQSTSTGVVGAVTGRSGIGGALRNLAFLGGGALTARSTFNIGTEFAQGLAVIQVQLGLTDEQLQKVNKSALQLGADIALPGVSAKEGADAINLMAAAGVNLEIVLDGGARAALTLARATKTDVTDAVKTVDDQINIFGLSGKQAQQVVDDLAGSIKLAGGATLENLSDSFKSASAVFADTFKTAGDGITNFRDLNAAIDLLGKNGVRGEEAGTGIRTALLRLSAPTKAAAADLKSFATDGGTALFDAAGKARTFGATFDIISKGLAKLPTEQARAAAIVEIFGTKSQIAARILTENNAELQKNIDLLAKGETQYDAITGRITKYGIATKIAAAQNQGLGGALDAVKSQFQTFQIQLFQLVNKPLGNALLTIARGIDSLANAPQWGSLRRTIVLTAAAIGTLLVAKTAAEAVQLLTTSLKLLATSPLGLLTVGIVAVSAAFGLAIFKYDDFNKKVIGGLNNFLIATIGKSLPARIREFLIPSDLRPLLKDPAVQNFLAGLDQPTPKETFITRTRDQITSAVQVSESALKSLTENFKLANAGLATGSTDPNDQSRKNAGDNEKGVVADIGRLGLAAGLAFNFQFAAAFEQTKTVFAPLIASGEAAIVELARLGAAKVAEEAPKVLAFGLEQGAKGIDFLQGIGNRLLAQAPDLLELGKTVGRFILDGIYQAGKLIATVLFDERTIKAAAATAAGIGAAAALVAGNFALGFIQGIIAKRGDIADAIFDIVKFAFKEAFKINPFLGLALLAVAAFKGIKLFSGIINELQILRENTGNAFRAMAGNVDEARTHQAAFQKEQRKLDTTGIKGLGDGWVSVGAKINNARQSVVDLGKTTKETVENLGKTTLTQPFGATTAATKTSTAVQQTLPFGTTTATQGVLFGDAAGGQSAELRAEQARLDLLRKQIGGNQIVDAQQTEETASRSTKALQAVGAAAIGAGAALGAYFAAQQGGVIQAITLTSAVGGIATALATGNPIAAASIGIGTVLGTVFGSQAKSAAEARARVKEYVEDLKSANPVMATFNRLNEEILNNEGDAGKLKTFLKGTSTDLDTFSRAVHGTADEYAAYRKVVEGADFGGDLNAKLNSLQFLAQQRKAALDAEKALEEYNRQLAISAHVTLPDVIAGINKFATSLKKDMQPTIDAAIAGLRILTGFTSGSFGAVGATGIPAMQSYAGAVAAAERALKDLDTQKDASIDKEKEFQRILKGLPATTAETSNALIAQARSNAESYDKILRGDVEARNNVVIGNQRAADEVNQQIAGIVTKAGSFDQALGPIQSLRDSLRDDLAAQLKITQGEAQKVIDKMLGIGGLSTKDLALKVLVDFTPNAELDALLKSLGLVKQVTVAPKKAADGSFSFDASTINGANAGGGLITSPTVRRLGEGFRRELVLPLDDPSTVEELLKRYRVLDLIGQRTGDPLFGQNIASAAQQSTKEVDDKDALKQIGDLTKKLAQPNARQIDINQIIIEGQGRPQTGFNFGPNDSADTSQIEDRRNEAADQLKELTSATTELINGNGRGGPDGSANRIKEIFDNLGLTHDEAVKAFEELEKIINIPDKVFTFDINYRLRNTDAVNAAIDQGVTDTTIQSILDSSPLGKIASAVQSKTTPVQASSIQPTGPVVGELHIHEVANDPVATATIAAYKVGQLVRSAG